MLKEKRERLHFHTFEGGRLKNKTGQFDEIDQMLVRRTLSRTKKLRKASGERFANVRTEKHEHLKNYFDKNSENQKNPKIPKVEH